MYPCGLGSSLTLVLQFKLRLEAAEFFAVNEDRSFVFCLFATSAIVNCIVTNYCELFN